MSRLIIINPVSGTGNALKIFESLKGRLGSEPYKQVVSEDADHIYNVANSANFSAFSSVIIFGGDGSLNDFINGMMNRPDGRHLPIGLVPAGTGNSLLHDLELLVPELALARIMSGNTRAIDVGKLSYEEKHIYAINVIGWGLPSTINQQAERLHFLGGQRYNMASLFEIIRHPIWPLNLSIEGEELSGDYSFFMACNTIHTGKGMRVAPDAKLDDGKFDLVLLKKATRLQMISLFRKIFSGAHVDDPLIEYRQVSSFTLAEVVPSTLIVDGQVVGTTPCSMEVVPRAVEIFF